MIPHTEPEYILKTILVGDSKVGKTSFLNLLQNNICLKTNTTLGVDFANLYFNINIYKNRMIIKNIKINKKKMKNNKNKFKYGNDIKYMHYNT